MLCEFSALAVDRPASALQFGQHAFDARRARSALGWVPTLDPGGSPRLVIVRWSENTNAARRRRSTIAGRPTWRSGSS
jgi:hypothetical protein